MDYRFTIEQHPTYLHAIATGDTTPENVRRFLLDAYHASIGRQRQSFLLELRLSGPSLDLASIYSVISERSFDGAMLGRIAYVDSSPEHASEMAEFAELAAQNRGVNVRLFRTVDAARRWLEDE